MSGNGDHPPFHPSESAPSMPEHTPEDDEATSGKSSATIATQTETGLVPDTSNDVATNTALSTIAKVKDHAYANSANINAAANYHNSSKIDYFAANNPKNNAQNTPKNSSPETNDDSNKATVNNSNPPSTPAASPDNERQTLLLMLLAQVCSLHDATPRTFVVHVLALFERGILGEESIRFLFELGLVPGGYSSNHNTGGGAGKDFEEIIHGNGRDERPIMNNLQRTQRQQQGKRPNFSKKTESNTSCENTPCSTNMGAIVPYCPRNNHVLSRFLPNTSSSASVTSSLSSFHSNVNHKSARTNVDLNVENINNSCSDASNIEGSSNGNGNTNHQDETAMLNQRKHQVSAIRQHLERHESLDSSVHDADNIAAMTTGAIGNGNGIKVGNNASFPNNSSENVLSSTSKRSNQKINSQPIKRGNSSVTRQSTLTSVEESFDNNNNNNSSGVADGSSKRAILSQSFQNRQLAIPTKQQPHHQPHLRTQRPPNTIPATNLPPHPNPFPTTTQTPMSWSVESHPLSLSRYQREFHQISLLATGSFGSVYHAIHKLEHRPYAVKKVTFSTTGYYADALSLVIREVRCLAQLDHPNCVRYYTSWLEPSWMTGGTSGGDGNVGFGGSSDDYDDSHLDNYYNEEEDDDDVEDVTGQRRERHATPFGGAGQNPKLLTDIERVVNDIHNVDGIPESVKQLEALLYGSNDGNEPFERNDINQKGASKMRNTESLDIGFDWGTTYCSGSSNDRIGEVMDSKQDAEDWGNLPSHQTNHFSFRSMESNEDCGEDSDVSEWTQDLSFRGGRGNTQLSSRWNSSHSSASNIDVDYATNSKVSVSGGLELGFPINNSNNLHIHNRRPSRTGEKRIAPQIPTAPSTYKYQICLFIQMQLCHPSSLADWIKDRNGNCESFGAEERQSRARVAFEIFRQIVNGLAHVHSKGIIHRDLKPANIFASDDGSWRIGDFGLSKMIQNANNNSNVGATEHDLYHPAVSSSAIMFPAEQTKIALQPAAWTFNDVHTKGVGTASYAAPEQISQKHYGPKADIFSLGLILLELFSNFTSDHERAKAFHDCRYRGELAPWMKRTYPEVSALVLACTHQDWRLRPSASEIQAAALFRETGNGVEIYRAELRSLKKEMLKKDDVIQMQKDQLEEKDSIIENLKRQLKMSESRNGVRSSVCAENYHYDLPVDECTTSDDDDNDY